MRSPRRSRVCRTRRSNIPARQIAMRDCPVRRRSNLSYGDGHALCRRAPVQVRDDERDWEGAAERLLRGFGLSLLVPDAHYARVARWVDENPPPAGRLVYFRVRDIARRPHRRERGRPAAPASRLPGAQAVHQAGQRVLRLAGARARAGASTWPAAPIRSSSAERPTRSPVPARSRPPGERQREGRPAPHRRSKPVRARLDQRGEDRGARFESAPHRVRAGRARPDGIAADAGRAAGDPGAARQPVGS